MNNNDLYTINADTEHWQWWLAITSPQISYNRPALSYQAVGMRADDKPAEQWIKEIGDSWSFSNRKELHDTIYSLVTAKVHGHVWQEEFARRACCSEHEWYRRIDTVSSEVAKGEMKYLDAVYRHTGTAGFRGWDYCRASFLARSGYYAGWVTEQELAFLLSYLSLQIQYDFNSWHQYMQSFIYGRTYWQYLVDEDSDEINIPYLLNNGFHLGISQFFSQLENDSDCPIHSLPWQTPLPRLTVPDSLQQLLDDSKETEAP